MNELIKSLLSASLSGTLLLLFILGWKPFYQNRFSKRWQYYVWLIVLLRFLFPFSPDTVNVGGLFERFAPAALPYEAPASQDVSVRANANETTQEQSQVQEQGQAQTQMQAQANKDTISTAAVRNRPSLSACLIFAWAAVAFSLFVRKVTLYQSFLQYVRAGSEEVADIRILNLLSDCVEKLRIKTRVELRQNALIASPMMIGFFHPCIVLPAGEPKDKELSHIFAHELIHHQQKDMFYKWLTQTVICLHWFNPFIYLLGKEVNQACELACDEKALSMLCGEERRAYGDTLISFLRADHSYKSALASVTLTEGAKQLKERLGAIMKFKEKTKCTAVISVLAAALLAIGGFSIGVYAAPTKSYIGTDAAKKAALTHARVQESKARYCNSWLEYKNRRPVCYEVEFIVGDIEYEYEIDLYSGAVLKYDTEYHNYSYLQSAGGNGVSGNGADIGQDAAKKAALAHAGVKESDARYCNSWLEYENKRPVYYEVEFVAGNIEYEYEIDMYNGTVLKCDTEYRDYRYSRPVDGAADSGGSAASGGVADIGQAAAKQAAFSHAGISEADVYHLKVERDYDDGWPTYEVEFRCDGMEYEIEIDAATGDVLKYDCDGAAVSVGSGSRGASGGVGISSGTGASGSAADIGQNAAKQAALNHAGLSESQVNRMEVEMDHDDGRLEYQVEFRCGGVEYEYDIDAATGNILKYKRDGD